MPRTSILGLAGRRLRLFAASSLSEAPSKPALLRARANADDRPRLRRARAGAIKDGKTSAAKTDSPVIDDLFAQHTKARGRLPRSIDSPSAPTPNRVSDEGLSYHVPTRHVNIDPTPRVHYGARPRPVPPRAAVIHPAAISLELVGAPSMHLSRLWLRDVCPCPLCVDPDSGQKTFSTGALPARPGVVSAEVNADTGALRVVWGEPGADEATHHVSEYDAKTVMGWIVDGPYRTPQLLPLQRTLWNRKTYERMLEKGETRVAYADWMEGGIPFWRAFETLLRTGLVVVSGVPTTETAVEDVAGRIGEIQTTFYGKTWDVKSKPRAENVAYTSQFLGLHQDLMYYDPVPRLQLLHCLENSCEGGESMFSDGLRAAYEMEVAHEGGMFESLTKPTPFFHYKKNGHDYEMRRETIHLAGNLINRLHWSPPFQAPFLRPSMEDTPEGPAVRIKSGRRGLEQWHEAAALFQRSVELGKNRVQMKLMPGECVVFDNWRVLHGRREFKPGQGERWLKGTYVSDQVTRARETELQRRDPVRFSRAERRPGLGDEIPRLEMDTHLNRAKLAKQERLGAVKLLKLEHSLE